MQRMTMMIGGEQTDRAKMCAQFEGVPLLYRRQSHPRKGLYVGEKTVMAEAAFFFFFFLEKLGTANGAELGKTGN